MGSPSVLVTGSSGMIGTALAETLQSRDIDVMGVDRRANRWVDELNDVTVRSDLRNADAIKSLPSTVDVVVHLAAHSRVRDTIEKPKKAMENIEITRTVLEYARTLDNATIVFGSSREVYGEKRLAHYAESDADLTAVQNPYAASKVGGEALVHAYRQCYNIKATVLRFSNVFGRYDDSDRVVPTFVNRAYQDAHLELYGTGKVLDLVYIDDCVQGILRTIKNREALDGETLNIASGTGTELKALAREVIRLTESNADFVVEDDRVGEVDTFVADIKKARDLIGYEPRTSLQEGMSRTVEWYTNRPAVLRSVGK